MNKKNGFFKFLICFIAFGIFGWYEYNLIKKYIQESKIRKEIIKKNTENIEKSFLIRKNEFYQDFKYIKKFKELKIKEQEKIENGGEDILD